MDAHDTHHAAQPPDDDRELLGAGGPLSAFAVSLLAFALAWGGLLDAGLMHDYGSRPSEAVTYAAFLAAAVVSLAVGYLLSRRLGWSRLGAGITALTSIVLGFFLGEALAFLVAAALGS